MDEDIVWDDGEDVEWDAPPQSPREQWLSSIQTASPIKRFARGLAEPVIGLGQLTANAGAFAGGILPDGAATALRDNADTYNEFSKDFLDESSAMAPKGDKWDVARGVGGAVPLAAAAIGTGGATLPATMGGLARAGAGWGLLGGAAAPVEDADNFAGQKGLQMVSGAGTGAVLGPAFQKLANGAVRAVNATLPKLQAMFRTGSMSPQQIEISIRQSLQSNGIDPAILEKASPTFLKGIMEEAKTALQAGGKLDEKALANRAAFETVGAKGTLGQLTQDGSQYGKEMTLRQVGTDNPLQAQYQGTLGLLNTRLSDMAGQGATPMLPHEAGKKILGGLLSVESKMKGGVDAAYKAARDAAGVQAPLQGARMAQEAQMELEKKLVGASLPADLRGVLTSLSTGKNTLTLGNAQEMLAAANAHLGGAKGAEKTAIGVFKSAMQNEIDRLGSEGNPVGEQTAQLFRTATKMAKDRFTKLDALPALQAVADGEAVPDTFMQKFVYNATNEEFKKLRATLRPESRESWNQIKGQALDDLRRAAMKGGDDPADFSQAAFNKALGALERGGKMQLMFSPAEIQMLKSVGRVGKLVQVPPAGVIANGLRGAPAAMGMLTDLIGKFGTMQRAAVKAAGGAVNEMKAAAQIANPAAALPPLLLRRPQLSRQGSGLLGSSGGTSTALVWDNDDPYGTAESVPR